MRLLFGPRRRLVWATVSAAWLTAVASAQQSDQESRQSAFAEGAGRETFVAVCSECHDPKVATGGARLSRDEWKEVVDSMVDRGAAISKEESAEIVEYLAAHYGKTLNVNIAHANDLERFFGIDAVEAQRIVDFRNASGKFMGWDDLAKVTGVDVKKLESKRASVTF